MYLVFKYSRLVKIKSWEITSLKWNILGRDIGRSSESHHRIVSTRGKHHRHQKNIAAQNQDQDVHNCENGEDGERHRMELNCRKRQFWMGIWRYLKEAFTGVISGTGTYRYKYIYTYTYIAWVNWGCRRGWDRLSTSKIFIVPKV